MEALRSWMTGIVCAAMLVALAESLSPKGTVRRVGTLTGAMVLLIALLRPLADWRGPDLGVLAAVEQPEPGGVSEQLARQNEKLVKEIIAEETGAYIVDKAAELGFACTVRVEVWAPEEGTPLPWSVEVVSSCTPDQRDGLERFIAGTLGIPAERQTYRREEVQ